MLDFRVYASRNNNIVWKLVDETTSENSGGHLIRIYSVEKNYDNEKTVLDLATAGSEPKHRILYAESDTTLNV